MSFQSIQTELSKIARRKQQLEGRLFTGLPGKVGLDSVDSLILALMPYASPTLRTRIARGRIGTFGEPPANLNKRQRFSPLVKEQVKAALRKGEKSASEISDELGPSVFSVRLWKKQWGLTRSRKGKTTPAPK
jgi:hypothetical protein